MIATNKIRNIAFLSTYPPRECGLATFTEDLVNEIDKIPFIQPSVIAVVDKEGYTNSQVKRKLSQHDRTSYLLTALWANDNVDLLVIEHEYGIFGGECGEYILDLAKRLKIPFIVTTHTVLLEPSPKQQAVLRELGRLSTKVVTMAESSIPILAGTYGIELEKLIFIPHGVPNMQVESREKLKINHGLQNKQVISSFGLISPAKGLEYGIEAVAKVVPDYENLMYLILGKTHPCVKESMGEKYRQSLMDLAQSLGVQDNIWFIDKYLTKEEVITHLHMSDMYLTPYLSKEQAVSGTLAYAMGCGRVIVSTPYRYAEEMLGGGRGMLGKFRDSDSIASCIRSVLANPVRKKEMEMKTLAVGRTMTWANVAAQYAELGMQIIDDRGNRTKNDTRRLVRPSIPNSHPHLAIVSRNGVKVG
ncbi:glycosyltransferase family 4 protein [Sporomusa malonica]|uniref:Glycosyltransferase involved in cell wall bisynthesis n=1 Tax=Sporomusa malonica TaxID=112901 RepID=A0A1W2ENU0_9FIRM|nr:glycosyltransferase family 4 protein [Sporomusa malonica]SMD11335.1 Glycosyltransferase involved in cell wall bisynthesis [Sporomusa malonica]